MSLHTILWCSYSSIFLQKVPRFSTVIKEAKEIRYLCRSPRPWIRRISWCWAERTTSPCSLSAGSCQRTLAHHTQTSLSCTNSMQTFFEIKDAINYIFYSIHCLIWGRIRPDGTPGSYLASRVAGWFFWFRRHDAIWHPPDLRLQQR